LEVTELDLEIPVKPADTVFIKPNQFSKEYSMQDQEHDQLGAQT
jgi:hypothetical protein